MLLIAQHHALNRSKHGHYFNEPDISHISDGGYYAKMVLCRIKLWELHKKVRRQLL